MPDHHSKRFENADQWAKVFDDPAREAWQNPDEVVAALNLKPSAVVADLGAGTGYFAMRLARALPEGRVFAVDVEPDMVRYLGQRVAKEGLKNVQSILAEAGDSRIPEPVDLILIVDTYHHIGDRIRYVKGLSRLLRINGQIAVIDFRREAPVGPPRNRRIAPEKVIEELDRAGFKLSKQHEFLPYQYFLVFEPR